MAIVVGFMSQPEVAGESSVIQMVLFHVPYSCVIRSRTPWGSGLYICMAIAWNWSIQPSQAWKNSPSQGPLAFMRAGEIYFVLGCDASRRGFKSEAEGPGSSVSVRSSKEKSGSL